MSKKSLSSIIVVILAAVALLFGAGDQLGIGSQSADSTAPSATQQNSSASTTSGQQSADHCLIINTFEGVADYLKQYNQLPCNYITKKQAEQLGWDSSKGNLAEIAPGKSIGGDTFGNREGLLPKASGRKWHEADINYTSGFRGADRIVYSTDGLIYKSTDHYKSFQRMP